MKQREIEKERDSLKVKLEEENSGRMANVMLESHKEIEKSNLT